MKKKVLPKLRQKVKVKVDIVTSDDIKIYYTGKFQDFTARYIINPINFLCAVSVLLCVSSDTLSCKESKTENGNQQFVLFSRYFLLFRLKFHCFSHI